MVIAVPPSNCGAFTETRNRCDDGSIAVIVGASGIRDGVPVRVVLLVPTPARFTARIRTVYDEPLTSPVIVIGDDVLAGERVVQFVPSKEYS